MDDSNNKTTVQLVQEIYQDFLIKAKQIEKDRDERIAALISDNDEERIRQILNDIKSRSNDS